jgi:hypothetical protein
LNGKQGTCVYDASAYSGVSLYYESTHPLRLVFTTTARKPINEGGVVGAGFDSLFEPTDGLGTLAAAGERYRA